MKKIFPYLMIAFGASLWGIIAIFVKGLGQYGFSAMQIVAIRVIFAAFFLVLIGLGRFRSEMKLKSPLDFRLFAGTGILSIVFFNYCYFTTINEINISMAVVLLYTSPAFVTVLSFVFLKEKVNMKKITAVAGTIVGCILIAGLSSGESKITFLGILTGLGSGLGYALYTIFGKFALRKYHPFTITLYTFLVAAAALIPVTGLWTKAELFLSGKVFLLSIGLGFIPTVMAYFVYTWGLEQTEGSKAAVIATVEPLVAMLLGIALYGESLNAIQIAGTLLILGSVVIVNLPSRKKKDLTLSQSQKNDL
ncbi:DMT family transporter [Cytobacillus sp. NCCP-133]|uniref:DMT family transporter n=1 Tax=Cytobacillus sp. NCCP-133 TaxID=766848 RepID=UPI00223033BB|nr:EamA family transporter [Cytobacillus sp. NCCP-133]GLB57929.1 EamA family transporter [Cytobacillus sp. NCCP-133]